MQFSLTRNDSSDIDFALACLMAGAIHFGEFKEWLYFVIEHATIHRTTFSICWMSNYTLTSSQYA